MQAAGAVAGAHHAGDTQLARHHGGVAEHATQVDYQG
jgi:hypothetical protein